MKRTLLAFTLVAAMPCGAMAATIFSDDFESYTDTADLGTVWNLGDGTLDTANGNPGQSLDHPATSGSFTGGNTNTVSFADVYPGPGEKLILQADIYDDGLNENKRTTIGLRDAAGANIIEMGMYNNPNHYAIRTSLFSSTPASDNAWVDFPGAPTFNGNPVAVEGWHRFRAEITDSSAVFSLDLQSDGSVDATYTATIFQNPNGFAFNQIRLGGPSDFSSTGGGVKFDNISLTLVPEPATGLLALLAMAPAACLRRR